MFNKLSEDDKALVVGRITTITSIEKHPLDTRPRLKSITLTFASEAGVISVEAEFEYVIGMNLGLVDRTTKVSIRKKNNKLEVQVTHTGPEYPEGPEETWGAQWVE